MVEIVWKIVEKFIIVNYDLIVEKYNIKINFKIEIENRKQIETL